MLFIELLFFFIFFWTEINVLFAYYDIATIMSSKTKNTTSIRDIGIHPCIPFATRQFDIGC